MGVVYKINQLVDKNTIGKIFVFYGKEEGKFREDEIFDKEELKYIRQHPDIEIIYSKQQIHADDTIGAIKYKLFAEFGNSIPLEEMYLFSKKKTL